MTKYVTDIVFIVGLVMNFVGVGVQFSWGQASLVCGSILMGAALLITGIRIVKG